MMVAPMAVTEDSAEIIAAFPSRHLPPVEVRELPEPPTSLRKIIGPGIVAAGIGLASGEFVLWPFIASQVGLVLLWGAVVVVVTQWFLNMEIERYTLATGETALTGFSRFWKHWGLVFALMTCFANLWPGWVISGATCFTYLFGGGSPTPIAIGMLLVIGAALTFAPVVYTMLERTLYVKIAAVVTLIVGAIIFVITKDAWMHLPQGVTEIGKIPPTLPFALVMGAIAFAGAGGGQNLCQSNYIRDKGYGMGAYVPRLVSPITGEEEAAPSTGFIFIPNAENMRRWHGWWKMANTEQAVTFGLISVLTIIATSLIAYSTAYGKPNLPQTVDFLNIQGQEMQRTVGPWFGSLFWFVGGFSLFAAALGIVDFTARLMADVLKTVYLRKSAMSMNRVYFVVVWVLVALGVLILLAGFSQPLTLLVISAVTGGLMMFIYSMLLILLNRRTLPKEIKITTGRVVALVWSTLLFGFLAVLSIQQQIEKILK